MQEGIIIKPGKKLSQGNNLEEKITKEYFSNPNKKEISFKTYKIKNRYEIEIL